MDKLKISDMTISDFEKISPVLSSDFDDFWTVEILKSEFNNKNSHYVVAKMQNNILGFAGIWKSIDDIHITNIVVKKDFRKNGIGSLLLQKLILLTKNLNYKELTLEVNINNIPAKKLYLKYGFKELGIRKKYYNNTDDAVIMTLYL